MQSKSRTKKKDKTRTPRYPNHTPKRGKKKKKKKGNEYPYVPHVYVKKQTAEY